MNKFYIKITKPKKIFIALLLSLTGLATAQAEDAHQLAAKGPNYDRYIILIDQTSSISDLGKQAARTIVQEVVRVKASRRNLQLKITTLGGENSTILYQGMVTPDTLEQELTKLQTALAPSNACSKSSDQLLNTILRSQPQHTYYTEGILWNILLISDGRFKETMPTLAQLKEYLTNHNPEKEHLVTNLINFIGQRYSDRLSPSALGALTIVTTSFQHTNVAGEDEELLDGLEYETFSLAHQQWVTKNTTALIAQMNKWPYSNSVVNGVCVDCKGNTLETIVTNNHQGNYVEFDFSALSTDNVQEYYTQVIHKITQPLESTALEEE